MGMFDTISVLCPETIKMLETTADSVSDCQTKDLDCAMLDYAIIPGGFLFRRQHVFETQDQLSARLLLCNLPPEKRDAFSTWLTRDKGPVPKGQSSMLGFMNELRIRHALSPQITGATWVPEYYSGVLEFYSGDTFRLELTHGEVQGELGPMPPPKSSPVFPRNILRVPNRYKWQYLAVSLFGLPTCYTLAGCADDRVSQQAAKRFAHLFPPPRIPEKVDNDPLITAVCEFYEQNDS